MSRERFFSILKIVAVILIIALSIYFSVWKVNFSELADSFRNANYWLALTIIPLGLFSHFIRAHRWKIILKEVHPNVRIRNLFAGVIVGYFMNNIISRSGELARPYVTSQSERDTSFSSLLGSILVERFIDVVALLLIVATVLMFDDRLFDGFEDFGLTFSALKEILYLAIILGIVAIVIAPSKFGYRIADFCTKPLPDRVRGKVLEIFRNLQKGFGAIQTLRQGVLVVLETVLLYFFYMVPLYLMFFAFPGSAQVDPTIVDAVKIWTLTALAFAVAPTPGAFGVFHVTARIALMKILAFSYADAVAYATITHFVNYMTVMVPGAYYLIARNISFWELRKAGPEKETTHRGTDIP